jgi:hypothetical protein
MKALTICAALLLSIPNISGAASPTNLKPAVSLQLGSVTVWLGMPEAQALTELRRAGLQVVSKANEGKTIFTDGHSFYSVAFKGDSVVYADREWLLSQKDEISAVLGALSTIAPRGATPCTVHHAQVSNPALQADRVFVHCGTKSVLITKEKEPGTDAVLTDVYEFIGTYV